MIVNNNVTYKVVINYRLFGTLRQGLILCAVHRIKELLMKYIRNFSTLSMNDVPLVGGKNAALGQMITHLADKGITIPQGFAITVDGYWHFLQSNNIEIPIKELLDSLPEDQNFEKIGIIGKKIRSLIQSGTIPLDLQQEIEQSYKELSQIYNSSECDVAVRSSATAEDLPHASFAGQQDSFLNIKGSQALFESVKNCIASLFNDRALIYRHEQKFEHIKVALSVGVQKMIRSDLGSSGVSFSLDPETGFKDVVVIDASFGLGETLVQGLVTPDLFTVHKPTLLQGFDSIIQKKRGSKDQKLIYRNDHKNTTIQVPISEKEQKIFALNDDEVLKLARMVITIEDYYTTLNNHWTPVDVEWAKDGNDQKIYIVQARPETVHSARVANEHTIATYQLGTGYPDHYKSQLLATGQSIGQKIVSGVARVLLDPSCMHLVNPGDIIVTEMTDPDWVPVMKKATAIVTQKGGRTCHAAIVSRELGIPAVVGIQDFMKNIKDGEQLTIDCSHGNVGFVYRGAIPYKVTEIPVETLTKAPVSIMVNIADPDAAYVTSRLPVDGVGLARVEFIIANLLKIHPLALLHPEQVNDPVTKKLIDDMTTGYADKKEFFIDVLSQGIGMIAAAFYPRPVIVRLSDFKTNEYRNLIGGSYFEPQEENPMLGLRGASRYCHPVYKEAFALECQALKRVCATMGLCNIKIMVPFVRTIAEAECVKGEIEKYGFKKTDGCNTEIIMMCELPSNVMLIDEFSKLFDGFSIGSNDLTQLTLAVDRESALLTTMFDERDPAAKKMFELAITGALRNNKPIGICGQAPSDFPELAEFFITSGITYLSLNPDCVLPFLERCKVTKNCA